MKGCLSKPKFLLILIMFLVTLSSCSNLNDDNNDDPEVLPTAISTVEELQGISGSDKEFYLKNDIDLSGISNWVPLEGFTGILEGNNFKVIGLTISDNNDNVGLFGTLEGTVKNLVFEQVSVEFNGVAEGIGTLTGRNKGIIQNVTVDGVVNAPTSNFVGGIVGINYGDLFDSVANVTVTGFDNVGGIVGYVDSENIEFSNNVSNGDVFGNAKVGGIAGSFVITYNDGTSPWTSYIDGTTNNGNVTGQDESVGGIVGYAEGNRNGFNYNGTFTIGITDSTNNGTVIGGKYTGGILGYGYKYVISILHCQNNGDISGDDFTGGYAGRAFLTEISHAINNNAIEGNAYVGGIAGYAGYIHNSQNTGTILSKSAIFDDEYTFAYVGGIAGYAKSLSNNVNFANFTVESGGIYVGGIAGYVSIENQEDGVEDNINNGDITSDGGQVGGIAGAIIIITKDGTQPWTAKVDENINNGNIESDGDYVGGIVGYSKGNRNGFNYDGTFTVSVSNSTNTGSVIGKTYTGGIIGYGMVYFGEILFCTNEGDVSGSTYIGGIAGKTITISRSQNKGNISSNEKMVYTDPVYIGGLVGYVENITHNTNYGNITYSSVGKYVGGIAGFSSGNALSNNINNGVIDSNGNYVGGITGYSGITESIDIEENENTNSIIGSSYVSGLFGFLEILNRDTNINLSDSVNRGDVTGRGESIGGIIGELKSGSGKQLNYLNLWNYGDIEGNKFIGGITGKSVSNVIVPISTTCTNEGVITGVEETGDLIGGY